MIDKQKIEQSFEDIQTLFFRLTTVINYWNDENYLRAVDWLQNLDTVRYDLFQNNSHYHHHYHHHHKLSLLPGMKCEDI